MNMMRRSEEEDPFSKASRKLLDWKYGCEWDWHSPGGGKGGEGEYTLWKDRETYMPTQLQRQNMSIQHVYEGGRTH